MQTVFLYLLVTYFLTKVLAMGDLNCTNDNDCSEENSCHDNICVQCLHCKVIYRKGSDCVLDFSQCGECLEGFVEVLVTHSSSALKPCRPIELKINNCPPGYYFHDESCVKCFSCSLVSRLSPERGCAKEVNDCGECLEGYKKVAVTSDSIYKICEKNNVTVEVVEEVGFMFLFTFLIFLIICLIYAIYWSKVKGSVKSLPNIFPSAPPIHFMEEMPEVFTESGGKVNLHSTSLCESTFAFEQKQQAKIFKQPTAPYYWTDDETRNRNENHTGSYLGLIPLEEQSPENSYLGLIPLEEQSPENNDIVNDTGSVNPTAENEGTDTTQEDNSSVSLCERCYPETQKSS